MARTKSNGSKDSSANLGFEAKLWLAADKLAESAKLEQAIEANLRGLGYGA